MTTLKELTQANHELAEQHSFTKLLLTGKMPVGIYASFVANQFVQYQALECAAKHLLAQIPGLARSELILEDLLELEQPVIFFDTTHKYCKYVKGLTDPQLWAHIYVKHMGDLYGGQLIKTKVMGSGLWYSFSDRKLLIDQLRSKLDISMAAEANVCFEHAIELFNRIASEYNL